MFTDALICRKDLPRDAFQLIRAMAYDREVPRDYRKDAQKILKSDSDLVNVVRAAIKRTRIQQGDRAKERAGLIKECDALCSALVIARDKACVRCGFPMRPQLASCHIIPKGRAPRLRFELFNLMAMCYPCHLGNGGWHKDPANSMVWFNAKYPGKYDQLVELHATARNPDLKELAICLREEVKQLGGS